MFLLRQIPNILTLSRFVAIPYMVMAILDSEYHLALLIIVYIQAADFLDGNIARAFGWTSGFGAQMDPAADKTFLMSFWISMLYMGQVPAWLALICVGRDVINWLRSIIFFFYASKTKVKVMAIGKVTTTMQLASGIATLLILQGEDLSGYHGGFYSFSLHFRNPIYFVTVFVTVLSGLMYIVRDIKDYGPAAQKEIEAEDADCVIGHD